MRIVFCLLCFITLAYKPVTAQNPPAVPVEHVRSEKLSEMRAAPSKQKQDSENISFSGNLTVLELFTTQACTFCPKADALMNKLAHKKGLIALSCHVDYFDVEKGSLSLPICTTRQMAYEIALDTGPKYTPQIMVNGRYDAVGYIPDEIEAAFKKSEKSRISKIKIQQKDEELFELTLPELVFGEYKIWLFVFDHPHKIKVAGGANVGKDMVYYNVVSNAGFLGEWSGNAKAFKVDPKLKEFSKGFAVIAQDANTHHIIAAAQYLK